MVSSTRINTSSRHSPSHNNSISTRNTFRSRHRSTQSSSAVVVVVEHTLAVVVVGSNHPVVALVGSILVVEDLVGILVGMTTRLVFAQLKKASAGKIAKNNGADGKH